MAKSCKISYFLLLLGFSFLSYSDDSKDVENLLEGIDKALSGETKTTKDEAEITDSKKQNTEETPENPKINPPVTKPNVSDVVPIASPDSEKILKVDLNAIKKESEDFYPKYIGHLSFATGNLGKGITLKKDDDNFDLIKKSQSGRSRRRGEHPVEN